MFRAFPSSLSSESRTFPSKIPRYFACAQSLRCDAQSCFESLFQSSKMIVGALDLSVSVSLELEFKAPGALILYLTSESLLPFVQFGQKSLLSS